MRKKVTGVGEEVGNAGGEGDVLEGIENYNDIADRICVCRCDDTQKVLKVDAKRGTAKGVKDDFLGKIGVSSEYYHLFSLWLEDNRLSLPLKGFYIAKKVWKQWPELWVNFTGCSPDGVVQPQFTIKRSAFLTKIVERQFIDESVIQLLYEECRQRVQQGFYPTSPVDAAQLAGLSLQLDKGDWDPVKFSASFYTIDNLVQVISAKVLPQRPGKWWGDAVQRAHAYHTGKNDKTLLRRLYLQIARTWPIYGAIFFMARLSQPPNYEKDDEPLVRIAINIDGLFLIKVADSSLIATYDITRLAWQLDDNMDYNQLYFEYTNDTNTTQEKTIFVLRTFQGSLVQMALIRILQMIQQQEELISTMRTKNIPVTEKMVADAIEANNIAKRNTTKTK